MVYSAGGLFHVPGALSPWDDPGRGHLENYGENA